MERFCFLVFFIVTLQFTGLHANNFFNDGLEKTYNFSVMAEMKLMLESRVLMKTDPRVDMTVPEMIRFYGYEAESHNVTTVDGYILQLHRVLTAGNDSCKVNQCEPVFLQHGFLAASSSWIMNDPDKAIAYILADSGYDVWMGNARGNIYSMNHVNLSTSTYEFWNFTFDEMGKYDLPDAFDYVLQATNNTQLHYVGHSMGTIMFWVLANERPEYMSKVRSMSALGPVAYVKHIESPIKYLAPYNKELQWYRIFTPNFVIKKLTEEACTTFRFSELVCSDLIFLLVGFDSHDLNLSWLPVILAQLNGGASTKTMVHFAQLIQSGEFCKFDYNSPSSNLLHYNQTTPPTYSLDTIPVPVLMKWGPNDWLADPKDVAHLISKFDQSNLSASAVSSDKFNHLDFLWGLDAKEKVYDEVMRFMAVH